MVHIRHIREKMKDRENTRAYIQNVWGVGISSRNTMKRTVWIPLAAIAVVAEFIRCGICWATVCCGNFLSEQFFYMEEYTDTTGILHQYLSPNWYRIKQLLFC